MSELPTPKSAKFGPFSLTCLVIANTIGAGVYTTSGFTLADLGSREAVLGVWFAASLLALSGAISFAALARAMPQSGGEYVFLSRLFHPAVGFIAGWVSLIAGFAGAQAFGAIAFTEYLSWQNPQLEKAVAVAILIGLALLHGRLVLLGTALQNLTVGAKALFLALFIAVGWSQLPEIQEVSASTASGFWVWPRNILWVSLSFTGFNAAIYVAEECRDPRRDIPRALLWGTAITALLYLAVNAVFLYSAPLDKLRGAGDIALVSAEALGGPGLRTAVQGLVLLSLFTLLSGTAVSGPRVVVKMGEDGFLPPFSLTQAAVIQCAISVVMTLYSDLRGQLEYLSLTLSLVSALTVATVYRLPKAQRPFPIFPLFYLTVTTLAALAALRERPIQGIFAVGTLVSGGLLYLLVQRNSKITRARLEP